MLSYARILNRASNVAHIILQSGWQLPICATKRGCCESAHLSGCMHLLARPETKGIIVIADLDKTRQQL